MSSTAIVGAGIVGIAVAYYLAVKHRRRDVVLVEAGQPMGLTSARSGENFRNWWPHPVMQEFTTDSIVAMEEIARATGNRIRMTRRGYALATRRDDVAPLIAELHDGYGADAGRLVRVHEGTGTGYAPALSSAWESAPDGVDVLRGAGLVAAHFPGFDASVSTVMHIRRGGDISGQQLGQAMLEGFREAGGRLVRGRVTGIAPGFVLALADGSALRAETVVNAAGPHVAEIAAMLGEKLAVTNVLQQKIMFEDRDGTVPRSRPFSIDLDGQEIGWTAEERALLTEDPATAWLAQPMQGGIHCRPDGGDGGRWVKLGWAYNHAPSEVVAEPVLDANFPDIVLRGASRLQPALARYVGRLPRGAVHYGGYYTMTAENWPLIGPTATPGAFIAGALSGFGTMAACATGALCAGWIGGTPLPSYAAALSPARYGDAGLMAVLAGQGKGVL